MLKVAALLLVGCTTLGAQAPANDMQTLWSQSTDNVLKSATQAPESLYSFKPTASVRTFGQILAHVAGSQDMFCAAALGEKPSAEDAIEKTKTTKADIVAALKASNDRCAKAYVMPFQDLQGKAELFGQSMSKRYWLLANAGHNMEHYGNLVTYMRINNMVPPTSQPAK